MQLPRKTPPTKRTGTSFARTFARNSTVALAKLFARIGHVLPREHAQWLDAIASELHQIVDDRAALAFALSGYSGVARMIVTAQFASLLSQFKWLSALAGSLVVLMGCGLMWRNDVPKTVVLMQIGALGVALVFMVIASSVTRSFNLHRTRTHPDTPEDHISLCVLSAGVLILYTAIEGHAANGVSRWLSIGGTGISIQPSVMLMPAMLIAAAILRNALATIGVALAFLGLAFQGDALLAFASAMAIAISLLAARRTYWLTFVLLVYALLCCVVALRNAVTLPPVAHVDQALQSAFAWTPFAGFAALVMAILTILPPQKNLARHIRKNTSVQIHVAVWGTLIAASALGLQATPLPLLSFGGSAIIGFFLSLALIGEHQHIDPQSSVKTNDQA
jgi:cell division protein FtsW (lipid II flippase)